MRGHLRVAEIRITVNSEPATVKRVKAKLRLAGVDSPEAQAAVGMSLAKWLAANPRLPLWAALALVLEGTGRFTPMSPAPEGCPCDSRPSVNLAQSGQPE